MLQNYLYLKPTSCYNMTDTNQRDTEKIMQLRYEIPDILEFVPFGKPGDLHGVAVGD